MAIGSKAKYSEKQKRKAAHIEQSYEQKGVPRHKAEEIAWATVNKHSGGGERSGSGKNTSPTDKAAARRDSARRALNSRRANEGEGALQSHSKEYLLAQARKHHIAGRSSMNKPELILALQQVANTR
ncbi:MAG TPA: termination factor Rho [Cellvibrio sp.]|nr:termination factor Rho [Cellvibrio sp.]